MKTDAEVGMVIVRFDAPIYFANSGYIKDSLRDHEANFDGSSKCGPERK